MSFSKAWPEFIEDSSIETGKENFLLQNIIDFHIHPVDSFTDEQETKSQFTETTNQPDRKLKKAPQSRSWRRHSEGTIILTDLASPKSPLTPDEEKTVPRLLPLNRLWLQGPKLDHNIPSAPYPVRNPAGRVLNLEKAYSRSRSRFLDRNSMQRLNISPVRSEPNRRNVSRIFLPAKKCATGQRNRVSSDETKEIEPDPAVSQTSDYTDVSEIETLRADKRRTCESQSAKEALARKSPDVSNSKSSSEKTDIAEKEMSVLTTSPDAIIRKANCESQILCESPKIDRQDLKNCLVTYIPEHGRRFVTYISDNALQTDEKHKEFNNKIVSAEGNKLYVDPSLCLVDQVNNPKRISDKIEAKENNLNFPLHSTLKFIRNKSIDNTRRQPIKSLTSRAIPIDSPDLKPVCSTASTQMQNIQTKNKFFRRKETVREFSAAPSYAPDSAIMVPSQTAARERNNLKFNRIWTNRQKTYVTDPVADFRKEVKKRTQTPHGFLKPRLVQASGGHRKLIACHFPDKQLSTAHAAVRHIDDQTKIRQMEQSQRKLVKGKNYAVLIPNVHQISGNDSVPIYLMSSNSMHTRIFQNEMDA